MGHSTAAMIRAGLPADLRSDCKKAAEINKRENVDWKAG